MTAPTLARQPGPGGAPHAVLTIYGAALRRAHAGHPTRLVLRDDRGDDHLLDPAAWCRDTIAGDDALLSRCTGPTLDVGCGPGRLTAALLRAGHPALGIDVSAAAVRLARRRATTVLRRDVFDPLPGSGRWRHLLLADGNIGIGGDPHRLLRRCRELIAPDGRVHTELAAPGTRSWCGTASIRHDDADSSGFDSARSDSARSDSADFGSADFDWAVVAVDDLPRLAVAVDLRILDTWTEANRWFATLAPA